MEDSGNQAALPAAPLLDSSPAPSAAAQGRSRNWMLENLQCQRQCPVFLPTILKEKEKHKYRSILFLTKMSHNLYPLLWDKNEILNLLSNT